MSLLRGRFPAARVVVEGNDRGTVRVEVWHGRGHAEAVFLRYETIGGTDFRVELGPDDDPIAPWSVTIPSLAAAFEFLTRALA